MVGKLPPELLRKYIFSRIGVKDPKVIVGPAYGEDAAIISLGEKVLVVHVDPITGAVEWLGWLAVHIACNDIAVRGAKPKWLLCVLYLPEKATEELIDKITSQIDSAARELGVMIVGGHSEYTPGLDRPLISMTAIGLANKDKYVRTAGVKPGDYILMTKTVAIEGTSILATDFADKLKERGVSEELIKSGANFIRRIGVLKEALTLTEVGVHSMHDPTEGGLLGGIAEMAYASNVEIEIWEDKVPIAKETKTFCEVLGIDPLKLISSGVLLAAVPPENVDRALKELNRVGINASIIGKAREGRGVILHRKTGIVERVPEHIVDELYKLWVTS